MNVTVKYSDSDYEQPTGARVMFSSESNKITYKPTKTKFSVRSVGVYDMDDLICH